MGTYNRTSFLTTFGNRPVQAAGEKAFVISGGKSRVITKPGEATVFDPDTGDTLGLGDINKNRKISIAVGVKDAQGKTQLKYVGGERFDLCETIVKVKASPAVCGCPQVMDYWIGDCVDSDAAHSLRVHLEDGLTRSFYPQNDYYDYVFTAMSTSEGCEGCDQTGVCSDIICQWVEQINHGFTSDKDKLTLDLLQHQNWDDRYQPFRAAQLYPNSYTVNLAYVDVDTCENCGFIDAVGGITLDGGTTVIEFPDTIGAADDAMTMDDAHSVVYQINEALRDTGGSAYLSRSANKCCPVSIEINTCLDEADIYLVEADGTTEITKVASANTASFQNSVTCKSCDDAGTTTPTCGIRIFVDPVSFDCNCRFPENEYTEKLNYYGRTIKAEMTAEGDKTFQFWEKEVCAQVLPEGVGYLIQLDELSQEDNGGKARQWRHSTRNVGKYPLPDAFSKFSNVGTQCAEQYCQLSLITGNVRPREKYQNISMRSLLDLTFINVPQEDLVTQGSLAQYLAVFQAKGICSKEAVLSCYSGTDDLVTGETSVEDTIDVSANDPDYAETCVDYTADPPVDGTITYELISGSEINVTVDDAASPTFAYTPTADGAFSFSVNVVCNGIVLNTQKISGVSVTI